MAWTQIKIRIIGNSSKRAGSLSRRMLFIWCMLASVIFYMIPQNSSNKLQLAFAHVFRVPLSASREISISAGAKQQHDDTVPKKQYDELKNRYANLEQQLIKQIKEFRRLSDLNSYVGQNVDYILGDVIPAAADNQHSELTIKCRGTTGLEKGQFVLARNNSIIGRITDIFPQLGTAKVRLITNPDSNTAVQIDGLNKKLYMQGNGDNTAKISMVPKEQDIRIGQQVFALSQPGFIDSDMIIGTISRFKQDDKAPLLWDITVKPAWELEELNEIAVIISKQQKK
ncbi:MAG: hypothetical protein JW787_08260 [Sedimentisphaerales bacterium]|nr:hypothetical protein [Sedimentisphaerales bacterium]